jgi:hypothetical protein
MSRNARERARLNVEVLEGRLLLSAHLASALTGALVTSGPSATFAVTSGTTQSPTVTAPKAPHAYIRTYGVLSLRNDTGAALSFEFRWASNQAWTTVTLAAGASRYFWAFGIKVTPQVQINANPKTGTQAAAFNLNYKTVTQVPAPTYAEALHYNIMRAGSTLKLATASY